MLKVGGIKGDVNKPGAHAGEIPKQILWTFFNLDNYSIAFANPKLGEIICDSTTLVVQVSVTMRSSIG